MTLRKIAFLSLLIGGTFVLTGALHYPDLLERMNSGVRGTSSLGFLHSTRDDFVAGAITLPQGWESPQLQASDFLDSIQANFHPARFSWLDLTLWQRSRDDDVTFIAEGRLRTGPDNKARLEWKIQRRQPTHVVVVSDGQKIRRTLHTGGEAFHVDKVSLPPTSDPRRDKILENFGCTGFCPLLADLRTRGKDWRKTTGLWRGLPVIRLSTTLEPTANNSAPRARATSADIFLDATNLWPLRCEWSQAGRVDLEMEFRSPRINTPPGNDELVQLFAISD